MTAAIGPRQTPEEMAELIFERVVAYAGMRHWPLRLLPPDSCVLQPAAQVRMVTAARGSRGVVATDAGAASLTLSYEPEYPRNPEAMIAVFAHTLAHYLGTSASEPPPGGTENWPQVTEILAVFLGFGLMFANTAMVLPRGGPRTAQPLPLPLFLRGYWGWKSSQGQRSVNQVKATINAARRGASSRSRSPRSRWTGQRREDAHDPHAYAGRRAGMHGTCGRRPTASPLGPRQGRGL